MHPDKAFEEVFEKGYKWLNDGILPMQMTKTNIVLIHKCEDLRSMKDLRPISVCKFFIMLYQRCLLID